MDIAALDRHSTTLLLALGFSPKNIGFYYLRQALILTVQDPSLLELITKNLYPDLAKIFNTKPMDVERTIRFAIGDWYKEKTPGDQIQAAEVGNVTVPDYCPSNLCLLKGLTALLQNAHTLPL